jgi:UDP-N-acetylglucosamine 4-epimerase
VDAVHDEPRPGDVRDSLADISLAKELLGYDVSVPFAEGLERTVAWYRDGVPRGSG